MLTDKVYEDAGLDDLEPRIRNVWHQFVARDLDRVIEVVVEEYTDIIPSRDDAAEL